MTGGRAARFSLLLATAGFGAGSSACSETTDHLGYDGAESGAPPAFERILGKTAPEINAKIEGAFQQLFYGDPATEAIYFEEGGGAYVLNVLAGDRRTDGLGYAMLITVELDRRQEFDRLWSLGTQTMRYASGPLQDYLYWECFGGQCPDPNGTSYAATALLMAESRWGEARYGADGRALLAAMLHKEEQNGGVVDGVHAMVDASTGLVVSSPRISDEVTLSFLLPAFYEYWARRIPEDAAAWRQSAAAARGFLEDAAHASTGLVPERASLDAVPSADRFYVESYRVALNIAVDHDWYGTTSHLPVVERQLSFFAGQGEYLADYTLSGEPLASSRSTALIAANGAGAAALGAAEHRAFVQAVWDLPIPTGAGRTYDGLVYLLSLLQLGGRFDPL